MPSHRALALLRGRNEGMLHLTLVLDAERRGEDPARHLTLRAAHRRAFRRSRNQSRPADEWLQDTVRWTWRVKLLTHLELDLMNELRERAEEEAIRVFAQQPEGPAARRAGRPAARPWASTPASAPACKVAVVDATGKLLDTATIYPHEPRSDWDGSMPPLPQTGHEAQGRADRASATAPPAAKPTSWCGDLHAALIRNCG